MTIEEGTGDEFLLTCFVCKNPFGLVAQFCGYCQATRQQALGVERARPNQQILGVAPERKIEAPVQRAEPAAGAFLPPKPITPRVNKPIVKSVKPPSMFIANLGLRAKNLGTWQKKHSKPIVLVGLACFIFSTYFSVQSIIFLTGSPIEVAEKHLYLGATRNTSYFEGSSENNGIRFFPTRFINWPESTASRWDSSASWNGWRGTASVDFLAAGNDLGGVPITGKYKAEYSTVLGIFRKVQWVAQAPAVIDIKYPSMNNVAIYINGLAAGTTSQPSVSEGKYQIYPGPLTLTFYNSSTGDEIAEYSRYLFIDAQGSYELRFD
jgi:hypothetical protein